MRIDPSIVFCNDWLLGCKYAGLSIILESRFLYKNPFYREHGLFLVRECIMNGKSLSSAFLTAIMVSGSILVNAMHFGTVQAATEVTGIISSDTTWTKANSPYSLTGPTAVGEGVTLTIEAGATVNLNDYYIEVNGTLRAKGTSTDKIRINGVSGDPPMGVALVPFTYGIRFTTVSEVYNEHTGSGCIIENAIIDSTTIYARGSKISNNVINGFIGAGGSAIITNNVITGKVTATNLAVVSSNTIMGEIELRWDSPSILDNIITGHGGTGISVESTDNALISNNTISGCNTGIYLGGLVTIEKNLIINNDNGISIYSGVYYGGSATIRDNTISKNDVGIKYIVDVNCSISYNNFQNNSYNLYSDISEDIDAINNWWGTTDTQVIKQSIYDAEDDFNLGTVNFVPFLTEPNPEAPEATYVPTTTPPPANSPTPTPTATPHQEPQQTELITIIGAAIVVAVLGAGLGLLIYLIKRK
jgi:parallel beta-helix repeat protein